MTKKLGLKVVKQLKKVDKRLAAFVLLLLALVITAVSWFWWPGPVFWIQVFGAEVKVVLTADGYQPSDLTIKPGTTVVFSTELGRPHWPASNLHPSHNVYPDFDPRQSVSAEETWQYTFTEAGEYEFHDHLSPIYQGVIYVLNDAGEKIKIECTDNAGPDCWEELVTETVLEKGVTAAFVLLTRLSESEPDFLRECHSYAHIIGEVAYELYANDEPLELSGDTSVCGFGFYHGFMETLLLTSGNVTEAREFCAMVDQQLAEDASSAWTACYHGTGHGAVDGGDPSAWGNIEAMMEPGFKLCDLIAADSHQAYLCHTGVFNAIEILSQDPKYGLVELQTDPFALCYRQPPERLEACYTNMLPIVSRLVNDDFAATADYVNEHMLYSDTPTVDNYTTNDMVTLSIFAEFLRLHGQDDDYAMKGIEICRAQPEEDHLPCIEGLSAGHVKYGPPGRGYIKNLEFCSLEVLTEAEEDACYGFILPRLRNQYNTELSRYICEQVPDAYQEKYCGYLYNI